MCCERERDAAGSLSHPSARFTVTMLIPAYNVLHAAASEGVL